MMWLRLISCWVQAVFLVPALEELYFIPNFLCYYWVEN